ncbi:unnamed protein product, partial [Urochloa humidicola]
LVVSAYGVLLFIFRGSHRGSSSTPLSLSLPSLPADCDALLDLVSQEDLSIPNLSLHGKDEDAKMGSGRGRRDKPGRGGIATAWASDSSASIAGMSFLSFPWR